MADPKEILKGLQSKVSSLPRRKVLIPAIAVGFLILLWGVNALFMGKDEGKKPSEDKAAEEGDKKAAAVVVKVYKTARSDFQDILPSIGTIRGASTINLRFEQNGTIVKFVFKEGEFVKKGEVIAELDHQDSDLKVKFRQSKIESAKTNVISAAKKVEIHEKLYAANAIVKLKLDEIQLEYQKAKQELEGAKIEMESAQAESDKTYLVASTDGILGSRDVEVGEYVTSSVKVGSLIEIQDVLIEMGIIEKDVEKMEEGQPVKVMVDAYPDLDFEGEVDSIAPMVAGSRTITVKARVPNPDGLLLPGMFARVQIDVFSAKDAIVIPSVALNKGEEGYVVHVIQEDNTSVPVPVTVGYATSDKAMIEEGLEEGQQVVVDAKGELKEGTKVEIVDIQEG